METIIILVAVMLLLGWNRTDGVLGCGLLAFVPNKRQMANLDWIKMLFLANTSRGKDSCGIWINEEIKKGWATEADALSFMAMNPIAYEPKCKNRAIIAHTRSASVGARTEANAHPFTFEHEGRTIVLAHNGTLTDPRDLSKSFEVDITGLDVDSQMIGKIILERGYDVLSKYKGMAALVWSFSDEPNTIYVFKGASKARNKTDSVAEERPLCYIKTNEGVYISSLFEPLDAICNQEVDSYTFESNKVIRIKDNKFETVFVAEREEANVVFTPPRNTSNYYGGPSAASTRNINSAAYVKSIRLLKANETYLECTNAFQDAFYHTGAIYFMAGRYYSFPTETRNGDFKDIKHVWPMLENAEKYLLHGEVGVTWWGADGRKAHAYVASGNTSYFGEGAFKCTFYKGVLIDPTKEIRWKDKKQATRMDGLRVNPIEQTRQLSSFSKYPVTLLWSDAKKMKVEEQGVYYFGGNKVSDLIQLTPLFCNRKYVWTGKGHKVIHISSKIDIDPLLVGRTPQLFDSTGALIVPKDVLDNIMNRPDYSSIEDETTDEFVEDTEFEEVNRPAVLDILGPDKVPFKSTVGSDKMFRYVVRDAMLEADTLAQEEFNGVADVFYYRISDPHVSAKGAEIKKRAIMNYLKETIPNNQGTAEYRLYIDERSDLIIEEGEASQTGLISHMENRNQGMNFRFWLEVAAEQLLDEYYDEVYGTEEFINPAYGTPVKKDDWDKEDDEWDRTLFVNRRGLS